MLELADVPKHLTEMLRLVESSRVKLAALLNDDPQFSDVASKSLVSLTKASKDLSIELRQWSDKMKELAQRLSPEETINAIFAGILSLPSPTRRSLYDRLAAAEETRPDRVPLKTL